MPGMSVESALQALRLDLRFMRNIVRWEVLPARPARCAAFPPELADCLRAALAERGVHMPYTHQAAAIAAALAGAHVAVVTPAASGKTLCYNLPTLHRLLADPRARALYLFPTKALAQDQFAELRELTALLGEERGTGRQGGKAQQPPLTCATYDGDTPSGQRTRIRERARLVLSNPDMLHAGILPQHPRWAEFFANLRVVVLDEMHVYRGVFGSHVANVLRRLRRICRFYGSTPQFLLASATIANPDELAGRLVEAPVTVIGPEQDGAPQGEKHLLFYNPPLLDPALGIRRSSSLEAADLAAHLLAHDVQTIVFARARLTTELILTYLRGNAGLQGPAQAENNPRRSAIGHKPFAISHPPSAIRGYRGGYLPNDRREIERGLREGAVRGVVATNALELGIDIGRLDAAVLAGYPGAVASARQQLGRAGRRQGTSIGVLVAGPDAVDQYIIQHPAWLLARSPEHARLNPDNAVILAEHLACAAAELPLRAGEALGDAGPGGARSCRIDSGTARAELLADLLDDLVAAGQLYRSAERYYWAGDGAPTAALSLRSGAADRVVIQAADAAGRPQVIGELDREAAPSLLHTGAIYLHEGQTYLVESLDWAGGVAHVRPVEVDFYTRPVTAEKIEVLADRTAAGNEYPPENANSRLPAPSHWGDVRVVSQVTGYRMQHGGTNEVLGFGQVELPEQTLDTQACWLALPPELVERLKAAGAWFSDPNAYGPNWAAQREAARVRDGRRCQGCGAPEAPGRQHDVHHKVPFRAFTADAGLRGGLLAELAWQAANRLENLATLCSACHRRAEASVRIRSGLGGAAALLAAVAPLFLMCDPRDLGVLADPQDPVSGRPTLTLYERTPGGVGYAEQLHRSMSDLLQAALELVRACPCERGCPACVGPILEHDYALDTKALAAALLQEMRRTDLT